jgi:ABC-2 type transport system permease protein
MNDSLTMVRRNLRHISRYPTLPLSLVGTPIVFLLLFVFVFGGTLGNGIGGVGGRAEYLRYVTPGILLMAAAGAAQTTSISVAMDMTEGIIARFRTMAIKRASVLTGHVVGNLLQTVVSMAVVVGVALLLGFRPAAGPRQWLELAGLLVLVALALIWLAVALGLLAQSVEVASNLPMPLILLPFLGSGFVPTGTLPVGLRWFAEYQPFTPITETLRGLLLGTPIGSSAAQAVAWCLAIAAGGYWWARALYNR